MNTYLIYRRPPGGGRFQGSTTQEGETQRDACERALERFRHYADGPYADGTELIAIRRGALDFGLGRGQGAVQVYVVRSSPRVEPLDAQA